LAASLVWRGASSPTVGRTSSDRRDQDLMNAEAFCPLSARNLTDGVVDLAGLFVGQALVLHLTLAANGYGMVLLLALCGPLKGVDAVVELLAINVVDRVTRRRSGRQERFSDERVDRNPVVCPLTSRQAN